MTGAPGLVLALMLIGAAWGMTMPLSKIAVSGGLRDAGIIFWSATVGVVILGAFLAATGRRLRTDRRALGLYAFVALFGTLLPSAASYTAAIHLPAGVIALCLSLIPMMALPLAVALGLDRASPGRVAGLALGLGGVLLMVLPEASLPEPAMAVFLPLALIAPFFYAVEAVGLGRAGTDGLHPVEVLCGASLIAAAVALPVALARGSFIDPRAGLGAAEWAVAASGAINAVTYAAYVWVVGRGGAVFAAQVSYVVTAFGILWSMLILGETYSIWLWAALAAVFAGLFLVQPRPAEVAAGNTLVPPGPVANIAPDALPDGRGDRPAAAELEPE